MKTTKLNKFSVMLLLLLAGKSQAQTIQNQKMQWFEDAKLGIFIHWGIYSVNGISESWSFFNNYTNHDLYMKQLQGFNASKYNPVAWVDLIKESGAKYAVMTSKHHDGVSLWDTKAPKAISTLNQSAAKRDVLSPFVAALKKSGLRTGIYYSLPDWSYPDYDGFTRDRKRYSLKEEPKRWKTFLGYQQQQLKELSVKYNPDLLWFDGNWEHNDAEWEAAVIKQSLEKYNPNIIINSRLDGHGDYETPEQGIPVLKPESKYWELCYTMNDSWGYQPFDIKYKSSNMIIRTLVDCISMGGNLLLDIGPEADGSIAPEQTAILKGLGRWTKKHAEAIYGTRTGIPAGHVNAKTALSKDKKTLFLYLDYKDQTGIALTGISSDIEKADVVGYQGKGLTFDEPATGAYVLRIAQEAFDQDVTVVRVQFKEPLKLTDVTVPAQTAKELLSADKKQFSAAWKIKDLADQISKGINPLASTNLAADAFNFKPSVTPLDLEVNDWVVKHAEVLYKTTAGIPEGHYQGRTALSADQQTLYLFVEGQPTGPIAIKGLKNQINRIRIVGDGTILPYSIYNKLYWSKIPGIVYVDVPATRLDKTMTVIAVLLDGPADWYREKVGAIESNM